MSVYDRIAAETEYFSAVEDGRKAGMEEGMFQALRLHLRYRFGDAGESFADSVKDDFSSFDELRNALCYAFRVKSLALLEEHWYDVIQGKFPL